MKTYFYSLLFITLSCSLLPQVSHAQEASKKKEILPAKLAIIAIGPKPQRRYAEPEGGGASSAAIMLPPKPGEIPPRRLYFDIAEKKKQTAVSTEGENKPSQNQKSINVTFNNPSHFIEVPPNKTLQLQRRESLDSEPTSYISIAPLEPGSITLVLLRPGGTGDKRWVPKPRQSQINLLDDKLKNKALAILNLSRRPVKSVFHKDLQMIPSGGFQSYESIEGLELHRIAAAYGQDDKVIFNTALRLNRSSRLLFYVLYDANPNTNDGRTIGLFRTSMDPEEALKEMQDNQKELKKELAETLPPAPAQE